MDMQHNPEYLIGIDPGLATGMCLVLRDTRDYAKCVESVEAQPNEIAPKLRDWIESVLDTGLPLTIVVEAYIISTQTARKSQQGWSLEHIGLVKQVMRDYEMDLDSRLVMQKPAVKVIMDNDKLRRVGLWHVGGAGHANDALRHVAVRLINVGWRDQRLLAGD